jgi:signal transduction histidine kinase
VLTSPVAPLRQVLLNLISNAFRFADAASPRVRITVTRDADPDLVRIAVRDNGQGIAKEFQDRIWVIFQTLQARDDGGGSGIGLAVVRKLVEQHGGEAWVESGPGEGATFLFTWPHDYQEEEEPHR